MISRIFDRFKRINGNIVTYETKFLSIGYDRHSQNLIQFRLLGLWLYKIKNGRKYIFGVATKFDPKQILFDFLKDLESNGNLENKDRIVFLFNNTGETSFLLSSISLDSRDVLDKTLLIGTTFYHDQLAKIYCPNCDYHSANHLRWINLNWSEESPFIYRKIKVYLPGCFSYFREYEKEIRDCGKNDYCEHFYSRFIKFQSLNGKCKLFKPEISIETIRIANEKLKFQNINRPFILICSESSSNEEISDQFWITLSKEIYTLGYDVIFNSSRNSMACSFGHNFYTTFEESFVLASKAKAIVGIRSGILDLILPFVNTMIAIYTPFRYRSDELPVIEAEKVQKAFTLKKLPTAKNKKIQEYIVEDLSSFDVNNAVKNILELLKKSINASNS